MTNATKNIIAWRNLISLKISCRVKVIGTQMSNAKSLDAKEVAQLMTDIVNGKSIPRLTNKDRSWNMVYAGEVEFDVDGWRLVVFNDCDSIDYVDSVTSPDGRSGDFDSWIIPGDRWKINNPVDIAITTGRDYETLLKIFKAAK